ncbi:hypothetical protein INS49_004222 [Diaporthe citri]|uniref:uncharacterized protein n=1 Tax=Diaporthe citri TaxID=83186 RepID=UPI001C803F34|nr:uncharacterized protein INS49_004222 [Diaporthe citri]KAG6355141.1 hypothetical protein INS49_004222 [Diaporthe citri]
MQAHHVRIPFFALGGARQEEASARTATGSNRMRKMPPQEEQVKLRQIQSRTQKIFYPIKVADAIDPNNLKQERQSLRFMLDDWITGAPRNSKSTPATFQSPDWFQIAYSHGLLLLYRPSPACPAINLESLQICADSAISLISSYSSLYAKNKITYTWISLQSLFMASVTMLYTLWVSPQTRKSTRKVVVQSNVRSCLALFDAMEHHLPLAKRFYGIIDRLGQAAVGLFDPNNNETPSPLSADPDSAADFRQVDAEYIGWFANRNATLKEAASAILARGPIRGSYQGLFPWAVIEPTTKGAILIFTSSEVAYFASNNLALSPAVSATFGGVAGGAAQSYLTMGMTTCMKTVEATRNKEMAKGTRVPGTMETFFNILRTQGIRGVNKGVNAVALRQITGWSSRMGISKGAEGPIRGLTGKEKD